MSAYAEEVPPIGPADTAMAVLRKPFSADELYLAIRAELTRASELMAVVESEMVCTARGQLVDLVAAARELRDTAGKLTTPA